jgi:predicted AAA+ superfamily ATPase
MNDESQEQQQPFYACPYKGLIPFGEDDAPIFFGREKWCTIIADNLLASPLTLLYGPSGVGKSSVLQRLAG